MNLNQVNLIGRLTRDPELKALPSGIAVANFSLATSRTFKDRDGKKQEQTEFHNCVAFGKTAEIVGQYLKKGQLACVVGRIQTRSWDKDGHKNYRTEIMVEQLQMGPKTTGAPAQTQKSTDDEWGHWDDTVDAIAKDTNDSDIPF